MHFTLAVLQKLKNPQQKTYPTTVDGRNPKQPPGMYKTRRKKNSDFLHINWCRFSEPSTALMPEILVDR